MIPKEDLFVLSDYFRMIYDNEKNRDAAQEIFDETRDIKKVDEFCQKCTRAEKAENLLKKSKIYKRYEGRTFENFNAYNEITKKAKKIAFDYAKNINENLERGKNLIIAGSGCVGTGKTHLACAVAQEVMALGVPAKFINVCTMITEIRESFDISEFCKIELLIIDDMGKEKASDWVCENIYSIINNRYEQMLPTVVTTEKTIETMTEHYGDKGDAILSRILENFSFIELNGDDYRERRI